MPNLPKPTAIKMAQGNPGKRAINHQEPSPAVGLGKPPSHLSKGAKKVWKSLQKRVESMGVGTVVDQEAFGILCESQANWIDLIQEARKQGPLVKINGQVLVNPLLKRADAEAKKVRQFLTEFGLTPSSRSRLKTDGQPIDELEAFVSGGDSPAPAPMKLAGG